MVPWHLGVLVDEHERVGDVVVAHVHDRGPDPVPEAMLHGAHDRRHGAIALRRGLNAIQT